MGYKSGDILASNGATIKDSLPKDIQINREYEDCCDFFDDYYNDATNISHENETATNDSTDDVEDEDLGLQENGATYDFSVNDDEYVYYKY